MAWISKKKIALIHVAKKELGWSEEVYRHVLRDHGGVDSAADLDEAGFKRVLDHAKAVGFWVRRSFEQERPRDAGEMITQAQQQVITHLWNDLAEYDHSAYMLKVRRGFHQRVIKCPWPQTRADANRVIEALKNRVQRAMEARVKRSRVDKSGQPHG